MAVTRVYIGHSNTRQKVLAVGMMVVMGLFGILGSNVIAPILYHKEADQIDVSPGSIGSRADGSVPVVTTLEEMEGGEPFVLRNEEFGDWTNSTGERIGETYYNKITLEDGTILAARIHFEAQTEELVREEGEFITDYDHMIVTYPIGVMRPWPEEEQELAKAAGWITYKAGYLDMEGDFGVELPDLGKMKKDWSLKMLGAGLAVGLAATTVADLCMRRKEEQASTPQTEQELWILGTYANWAQYFGQLNYKGRLTTPNTAASFLYLGGRPKDEDSKKLTIKVLKKDWEIKNREDLLDTVEYMSKGNGFWNCTTQYDRAWELCRSTQLLGMGYIAGWLTKKEMLERSSVVGNIIQRVFGGWEELSESYLEAYTKWGMETFGQQAEAVIEMRRQIQQNLNNRKDSPYRLPWMLPLGMDSQRMERVKEKTGEV